MQGRNAEADAEIRAMLAAAPDAPSTWSGVGTLEMIRGNDTVARRLLERYAAAVALMKVPPLYRAFTFAERVIKSRLFGCRMCGQCALPATAYACPMTCPKQLRNGPCGGVSPNGDCEVYPGMRCVWLMAYERASEEGRITDLRRLQRPIDQRKWGQSSWVNYWLGDDEGLWTEEDALLHTPEMLLASASSGEGSA
jgi:hypothetical protein